MLLLMTRREKSKRDELFPASIEDIVIKSQIIFSAWSFQWSQFALTDTNLNPGIERSWKALSTGLQQKQQGGWRKLDCQDYNVTNTLGFLRIDTSRTLQVILPLLLLAGIYILHRVAVIYMYLLLIKHIKVY